jgi:hypothetical protein
MYKAIGLSFQEITRLALDPKLKHSASYCVSGQVPHIPGIFYRNTGRPIKFFRFRGPKN